MIKNSKEFREFEKDLIKKTPADYLINSKIADSLYREAVALKIFPLKKPIEGIEIDILFAKAINHVPGINKKNRA